MFFVLRSWPMLSGLLLAVAGLSAPLVLAHAQAAAGAGAGATPVIPPGVSPQLQEVVDSYRLCIAMNLPPDFRRVNDPDSAAQIAAQRCADRRLQVAGRFALDHPGTRATRHYIDGVTIRLVLELGHWMEDVNAERVSPNPAQRRTR